MADKAWQRVTAKDTSFGERISSLGVTGAMKIKRKLGMGVKKRVKHGKGLKPKSKKKRIIKTPKKIGGILPLLLPILGALGALGGGAAGIAKAVNDAKASKKQFAEAQRHNKTMETLIKGKGLRKKTKKKGKGMFLAPFKKNFQ